MWWNRFFSSHIFGRLSLLTITILLTQLLIFCQVMSVLMTYFSSNHWYYKLEYKNWQNDLLVAAWGFLCRALLKNQNDFTMLLQTDSVCLNVLQLNPAYSSPWTHIQIHAELCKHNPTLRMRIKSSLSTRRKWQLSSLRMMVAARGASFTNANCPKSSPSWSVVTKPCNKHTQDHLYLRWSTQYELQSNNGSICI